MCMWNVLYVWVCIYGDCSYCICPFVHVVQVLYKLSAVLSTNAVFHDCNSAINDVITRSQQVQPVMLLFNVQVLQPVSGPHCICTVKPLNNGDFGTSSIILIQFVVQRLSSLRDKIVLPCSFRGHRTCAL